MLETVSNHSSVFQKECKDKRAHIKYIPTFVSSNQDISPPQNVFFLCHFDVGSEGKVIRAVPIPDFHYTIDVAK